MCLFSNWKLFETVWASCNDVTLILRAFDQTWLLTDADCPPSKHGHLQVNFKVFRINLGPKWFLENLGEMVCV